MRKHYVKYCIWCKKLIKRPENWQLKNAKFCGKNCQGHWLASITNPPKPKIKINCKQCRKVIWKFQCEVRDRKIGGTYPSGFRKYENYFCSHACNAKYYRTGLRHPLWKNGKSKELDKRYERHSAKYRLWRWKVFNRDSKTCQLCGEKYPHVDIRAHHIKSYLLYSKLRFIVQNGITLCQKCHQLTFGIEEQLEPYLQQLVERG